MRTAILVTALTLACAAAAWVPPTRADTPAEARTLAKLVPQWMTAGHIRGVAIAHVRDGRIDNVQVFGERAPGVPMTADAEFNVASLTKPLFATMVMELVAEGKMTVDTRLADYWVDPDIANDPRRFALTPRLTLSHQSGLPNWRNDKLNFTFMPGSRVEYSGEGYEYTRQAVERLTGQTMAELMKTQVLAKAGMNHTYFGWNAAVAGHEVTGYDDAGKPLDMGELTGFEANAAAHTFTTVEDYARFAQWTLAGAGLPAAIRAEMATPQAQNADPAEYFGLGWRLTKIGNETVLSHDGRERGVRTQVFVLPDSREALVILTNSNQGELLTHPVAEATLGKGAELMQQVGVDTWRYLLSVPTEQFQPMVQGIARSPSFMSKLLYAVDATLVAKAGLSAEDRARAKLAIDPFVLGMIDGKVSLDEAKGLFPLLFADDAAHPHLRTEFTAAQAGAWRQALQTAVAEPVGPANR